MNRVDCMHFCFVFLLKKKSINVFRPIKAQMRARQTGSHCKLICVLHVSANAD